jgi:transcriptional regulator with XRE-family HTH domain
MIDVSEVCMSELRFNRVRLQKLMDEKGLVDAELASLAGVSKSTIYYLRTGKHKSTSAEKLRRIAVALGTTPEYLLGHDGAEPLDDHLVPVMLPAPIRHLAQVAMRLSELRQEEAIRIVEALEEMERAQPVLTLPLRAMDLLLDVAAELGIEEDESLDELLDLFRRQHSVRVIDLGPVQPIDDLRQD